MEACEGLIVINTGGAAMITAGAGGLFGFLVWVVKKIIEYQWAVNADLTETNRILAGTTRGAVETVKEERRASTGRQGR